MLCDVCVGVIQYRRNMRSVNITSYGREEWRYDNLEDHQQNLVCFTSSHHQTFSTLADSLSRGCPICQSLWEGLSEYEQDSMRNFDTTAENRDLTVLCIGGAVDGIYSISISVNRERKSLSACCLEPGQCLPYFVRTEFD
jgi:hypothetical protein